LSRKRILTIGRTGQVAQALASAAASRPDMDIVCLGRPDIDLGDPESLRAAITRYRPDLILNTGAYTNVDGAESEPEEAMRLNRDGPAHLAKIAAAEGCALVQLSTDCVFDGVLERAYRPGDPTFPLSIYGQSKLAGEEAVRVGLERHLIVRVTWIFSALGSNFVTKMLELAGKHDTLRVVSDQCGCPTYAPDLADGLLAMSLAALEPGFENWGTYHLAGTESLSRHHMAVAIIEESLRAGGPGAEVLPISTENFAAPARRPLNARLDSSRTEQVFSVRIEDWRKSLTRCVHELVMGETCR
jgi:dTDP-4-dehydrorhamnose reductase